MNSAAAPTENTGYTFPPEPNDALTVDGTWIKNVPSKDSFYWDHVRTAAAMLQSDGCTGVKDVYVDSCLEHDIHWRTGRTIYGVPITKQQANERFRRVIQSRSKLGRFSPLSWWRFGAVSVSKYFM